jgi:GxxExxY protein
MHHRGTEDTEKEKGSTLRDTLTDRVIGLAIDVHRALGPGLLESAYEECLCYDLKEAGLAFDRQLSLPVIYKSVKLDCAYRLDVVVEHKLLLEVKAVEKLLPIHEAQLLTYLRLSRLSTGLLLNFNATLLKDGIKRFVL